MAAYNQPSLTPTEDEKKLGFDHVERLEQEEPVANIDINLPGHHAEVAAEILRQAGTVEYTEEEDKAVLRKIDIWVVTPMVIIYILQQMDKSAVGYSSILGIIPSLKLVGTQYSWLASVVYIAQLVVQPLSSYVLVKYSVKKWLCFNMLSWGIVVICTPLAHEFKGILVARLLLGAFEATLAPAFVAIVQQTWRRREQTWRTVAWNVSNSIAGIIGPLLAYGVGKGAEKVGQIAPWRAVFYLLGAMTIAAVPIVWFMMPDSLVTAKFLNDRERVIALERLRDNNMGAGSTTVWDWGQTKEAFLDPKTWGWSLMLFCCAFPSGGLAAFSGLLIAGLGFTNFTALVLTIPPAVLGLIFLLSATWITNRIKLRYPVIAGLTLFPIGGALALRFVPASQVNARLGCFYIAYAYAALQPSVYAWAGINQAGKTKQRVTTAIMFVASCVGNIGGPFVYRTQDKPHYYLGIEVDIGCWGLLFITTLLMAWHMRRLNKKNEKRREALGHVGKRLDTSIMTLKEANVYNEQLKKDMEEAGHSEKLNANAFEDLTDLQNPDFHFAL